METTDQTVPLRVLIIDACEDATTSLAALVRLWGHEAREAHDGATGLRLAAEVLPDVLIVELALPDMSGWEVARRARRLPGLGDALLVVTSGFRRPDDFLSYAQTHCHCFLIKPADPRFLERLLATWQRDRVRHGS